MVKIDVKTCDRCGTCIAACPCNAIILDSELHVNNEVCTRCGACVNICPFGSLSLQGKL